MSDRRAYKERNESGEPCRQAPQLGKDLCFWHDPEQADAAREARRLGGVRRMELARFDGQVG